MKVKSLVLGSIFVLTLVASVAPSQAASIVGQLYNDTSVTFSKVNVGSFYNDQNMVDGHFDFEKAASGSKNWLTSAAFAPKGQVTLQDLSACTQDVMLTFDDDTNHILFVGADLCAGYHITDKLLGRN